MILDKEPYENKGQWTTTNVSGIQYRQMGHIVEVRMVNASLTGGVTYSVTGLPTPTLPSGGAIYAVPVQGSDAINNVGYFSYNVATNGWAVICAQTQNYNFCCFTYLTDE